MWLQVAGPPVEFVYKVLEAQVDVAKVEGAAETAAVQAVVKGCEGVGVARGIQVIAQLLYYSISSVPYSAVSGDHLEN